MSFLPNSLLAQRFDPSLVYIPKDKGLEPPQHVSDAYDWIDKLIALNNDNSAKIKGTIPTIYTLVDCMQRYDAIFCEIAKQISVFSERISSYQLSSWKAVMQLLESIIKSFHRHTKETKHVQEKAKSVIKHSREKEAEDKRNIEQFNFERASMRAHSRNLEANIESLSIENRILRRERDELRSVVEHYLTSGVEYAFSFEQKPDKPRAKSEPRGGDFELIASLDTNMNTSMDDSLAEMVKLSNLVQLLEEGYHRPKPDSTSALSSRMSTNIGSSTSLDFQPLKTRSDFGVQVDEKDVYGLVEAIVDENLIELSLTHSLQKIPWDELAKLPQVPSAIEAHLCNHFTARRIPSLDWLHQTIFSVYRDRSVLTPSLEQSSEMRVSMAAYIYQVFFKSRFTLQSAVDVQTTLLVRAVEAYTDSSIRVRLFARALGMQNAKLTLHPLDVSDCGLLHTVFATISNSNLMIDDPKIRMPIIPLSYAYEIVGELIGVWSDDAALDCTKGIRTLDTCGPKDSYVLVDEVLTVFVDNWRGVKTVWEDHIRYIAKKNCSLHRVVSELSYGQDASDAGYRTIASVHAKDVVLNRIQDKYEATDCMRRPVRIFDTHKARLISARDVCELLQQKEFYYACLAVHPAISDEEVEAMFQQACEMISAKSLRACAEEGGWREVILENGIKVYANVNHQKLQWTKPFEASSFRDSSCCDIDTFIAVVMQQNLLTRGPYAMFLGMKPEDFWPHADTFLKQKLETI